MCGLGTAGLKAMLAAKAAGYHGRLIFLANDDEQQVTHPQLFKVLKHIIYV